MLSVDQARKITDESLKGPAIEKHIQAIDSAISIAARRGKSAVMLNLSWAKDDHPNHEQEKALKRHYFTAGFDVKEHPNPDPRDPRSYAYTTIEW